jgi:23S rRNA (pseudouridine1915-N3)-methyltransferase
MLAAAFTLSRRNNCLSNRIITTRRFLTTNIYIVGKKNAAESFVTDGCNEYEKRLTPVMKVTTHFLKSDEQLVETAKGLKGVVYALDENGIEYTSRQFSDVVYKGLEDGGATLSFIIGGFAGLPSIIKQNPSYKFLSLSKMTWTHQMARLLLMEQIYRAVEIRKGSGYHKD